MSFMEFVGANTSPTAKITSGIVSLIILGLIYLLEWTPNDLPKGVLNVGFIFLAFHIINQLYAAIEDTSKKKFKKS